VAHAHGAASPAGRNQRRLSIVLAITSARVPMPKSSRTFIERCRTFRLALTSGELEASPESLRLGRLGYSLTS
jgi:hypothetical protein